MALGGVGPSRRPGLCLLGERILPLDDARIDPHDRGFLFGDGLYEGLKLLGGRILHLEPHLERLRGGLARVRIPEPPGLAGRCRELVAATGLETGFLYLQVTRGAGPRRRFPPTDFEPTVFAEATPRVYEPFGTRPMRVVTMPDPRWRHCDLKSISLMPTVTGKLLAAEAGADEILFAGDDGTLREGGSASLFVHRGERLVTYPLDGRILPGVTRALVLRLARELGLRVEERPPRLAERHKWREAFLTGTITGLQPLVEIDGAPVARGEAGPWTLELAAALAEVERREAGL